MVDDHRLQPTQTAPVRLGGRIRRRICRRIQVRRIGPFPLQLPLPPVTEGHQRGAKRPSALVPVLHARGVVPPSVGRLGWVGDGLRQLVGGDRRQVGQVLRVEAARVAHTASGVAREVEEEGDLDDGGGAERPAAAAARVPGAVALAVAFDVGVDGEVLGLAGGDAVGDDDLAD